MLVFWKIRYLNRLEKKLCDRDLHLNTSSLDPETRAAVEYVVESKSPHNSRRDIIKFKHLFSDSPMDRDNTSFGCGFSLSEYFEDEAGKEITFDEIAQVIAGSPTARAIPPGMPQHDIDLMFAMPTPISFAAATLSTEELRLLSYFARDLREFQSTVIMREGPGEFTLTGNRRPKLRTAATDVDIRSFVAIFRRIGLPGGHDPAGLKKIVPIFVNYLGNHPLAKWADAVAKSLEDVLDSVPNFVPFAKKAAFTFKTKRLLEVFFYTQYFHQPDQTREQQYKDCLAEANGDKEFLTWLFLTEAWKCGLTIINLGKIIAGWLDAYCTHHKISPEYLDSLANDHLGIGTGETEEVRLRRYRQQKTEQLAAELWEKDGRPAGGSFQYFALAGEKLKQKLGE